MARPKGGVSTRPLGVWCTPFKPIKEVIMIRVSTPLAAWFLSEQPERISIANGRYYLRVSR